MVSSTQLNKPMTTIAQRFDAYQEWLQIPPQEQPADHYRLLGLTKFERDGSKIAAAADERMSRVRSFQLGPHGELSQRILNELATAKTVLLDGKARAAYDAVLRTATPSSGQEGAWPPGQ